MVTDNQSQSDRIITWSFHPLLMLIFLFVHLFSVFPGQVLHVPNLLTICLGTHHIDYASVSHATSLFKVYLLAILNTSYMPNPLCNLQDLVQIENVRLFVKK